jgi:HK97 family phage prohead protease
MEHKTVSFITTEVKKDKINGIEVGIIEGYASTWDLDRGADIIMEGAFTETLATLAAQGRTIRMLSGHDYSDLIGGFPVKDCRQDSKGLYVKGEINLEVQTGREAYALAKQGVLCDMSIGFSLPMDSVEFKEVDGTIIRFIKKLELWEISLVPEPMNPNAQITAVKSRNLESIKDAENLLKEAGFTQEARKRIISIIKSSSRRDAGEDEPSHDDAAKQALALQSARLNLLLNKGA